MAAPHPERQYLDLLADVLARGDKRVDRTGVGTLSIFGAMARFDAGARFPALTTKRVYWKLAIKEMLWFLAGGTNIRPLLRENVRIWSDWPLARYRKETGEPISQEDFEACVVADAGFAEKWGELGPVYGKQWRRWLGPDGREHDQIAALIAGIKSSPASRRLLFHAWNVPEIDAMALPPCHMVYQFHVANGRLSCLMFQRSADLILGVPFNWAGAVALQAMIAQQCGLAVGDFVWMGGDVHVYLNHLDAAKTQLAREPRDWPTLRLTRQPASIDGYRIEDFDLAGYDPHPPIKADVAV
jgi:thymidylate synthase